MSLIIRIVFLMAFAVFLGNRFVFRPWINGQNIDGPLLVIANSVPNFCEAIVGVFLLTGLLLELQPRIARLHGLNLGAICNLATLFAGIYVLAQEFKLHDLGGNNVFDTNDVVASILGLIVANLVFKRFGSKVRPA